MMAIENALPTFHRDVPIDSVLSFKERRHAELLALRAAMDGAVLEAEQQGLTELANSAAYARFDNALRDHVRTMRETNFDKVLSTLKLSMNLTAVNRALTVAAVNVVTHSLPLTLASLGLFAADLLPTVSLTSSVGLKGRKSPLPFQYLTSVERELF